MTNSLKDKTRQQQQLNQQSKQEGRGTYQESAEKVAASEYGQGDSNDNRKGNDGTCESGDVFVSFNEGRAGPEALAYSTKAVGSKLDGDELVVLFCSNEV